MRKEEIIRRIDALLSMEPKEYPDHYERFQGALTLACMFYGEHSPQVRQLEAIVRKQILAPVCEGNAVATVIGILRTLRTEVDRGLVGDLRTSISGEVLADLLALAREVIGGGPDQNLTNVAGVLTAAAFEDTIRRMGEKVSGLTGRPKLSEVVEALKEKGALKGADLRTAQQLGLSLRNDALHADWPKITRPAVESLITFVEALLSKHFS